VVLTSGLSGAGSSNDGPITFDQGVNSRDDGMNSLNHGLTVNAGRGNISFNGGVGDVFQLGTLSVNVSGSTTGSVSFSASDPVNVSGAVYLNTPGHDISLADSSNTFGTIAVKGTNVTFSEADATVFQASNVTGNLTVTSAGSITQKSSTGAIYVGGTSAFHAQGGAVTLTAHNILYGPISLFSSGTSSIALTNYALTTISQAVTNGNLAITSYGQTNISSATVGGDFTLASSGPSLQIAATVGGNLTVTSSGPITQTNVLSVTGSTSFKATGKDITLNNPSNHFGGLSFAGKNVTITNNATTVLGTSSASGALNLTSTGDISQTDEAKLAVSGSLGITSGGAVDLSNTANTLVTLGNINCNGDLSLFDKSGGLTLIGRINDAAFNVTIVTSGGNLTMNGPVGQKISGADITLATTAHFINKAGAAALNASGWWRIYSISNIGNAPGGLAAPGEIVGAYPNPPLVHTDSNVFLFQK
jgi:hypothetical protein